MAEHFATDETISELDNVLRLIRDEEDAPEAIRRLEALMIELNANAVPDDGREAIAPGDYHYFNGGPATW